MNKRKNKWGVAKTARVYGVTLAEIRSRVKQCEKAVQEIESRIAEANKYEHTKKCVGPLTSDLAHAQTLHRRAVLDLEVFCAEREQAGMSIEKIDNCLRKTA